MSDEARVEVELALCGAQRRRTNAHRHANMLTRAVHVGDGDALADEPTGASCAAAAVAVLAVVIVAVVGQSRQRVDELLVEAEENRHAEFGLRLERAVGELATRHVVQTERFARAH